MVMMNFGKAALRSAAFGAAIFALPVLVVPHAQQAFAASAVKVVVNKTPITTDDIAKRAAFLRLQRQKGDLQTKAREQLVDEALKREEIARVKMSVSTSDVDASFARFAASNKMSVAQLTQVLSQAGVGAEHFKAYIAVQMSWPRLVNARYGSRGRMSTQDLVTRMQEKGKPQTTEYFLQQVIFVVPEAKRQSITGKRKAEAEASRARYPGCEQAKTFAATMIDVSIKDLGRILQPELPADWKDLVEKTKEGGTTGTRVTEKGVEYLAICKQRQVSDDYAAEMVFRAEDLAKQQDTGENPNEAKYIEELRKKARINNT
jgi:peptidyl-prolyl cis-trans isomerase SurA